MSPFERSMRALDRGTPTLVCAIAAIAFARNHWPIATALACLTTLIFAAVAMIDTSVRRS